MFSEEAVRLLQRTYASSGHQEDVGYVEFLADVARLAKYDGSDATVPPVVPCKPSSSAPSSSSAPPSKTSLDDLIYLLRVNSFAKGVRLFRFLRDADPLRRNCMTRTRFGAIVSSIANVNLTDAQLNTLQQAFPHAKEPDQIDYQRLHDAIEVRRPWCRDGAAPSGDCCGPQAAGHVKDLEMQPLSAPRRFTIVPAVPDVAPDEPIRSALESVCRFLTERNVTLVSFFKDFDRVNSGTISHAQFRSVLTSLDARVSKADENALLSRFTTPANRFNYRAFDKAVQLVLDERRRPHDQEQHLQASLVPIVAADDDLSEDAPHSARRDGGRVTYGKALHRLQTYLQGNGVRIVDLFTDFDQLRTVRVVPQTHNRSCTESPGAGARPARDVRPRPAHDRVRVQPRGDRPARRAVPGAGAPGLRRRRPLEAVRARRHGRVRRDRPRRPDPADRPVRAVPRRGLRRVAARDAAGYRRDRRDPGPPVGSR